MRCYALPKPWLRVIPFLQALRWMLLTILLALHPTSPAQHCPPCPPCPPPPTACVEQSQATCGECFYNITNMHESLELVSRANYFEMKCPDNVTLDDPSLPAFREMVNKSIVFIKACRVPTKSYRQALAQLNITVLEFLYINAPAAMLRDDHFEKLDHIQKLTVETDVDQPFKAESGLLRSLKSLRELSLTSVLIPPVALENVSESLTVLSLRQCRLKILPLAVLKLQQLQSLDIVDNELEQPPDIRGMKTVTSLYLAAPKIKHAILSSWVVNVTLESISNLRWEGECNSLEELTVRNYITNALPERWVQGCPKLNKLTLSLKNLTIIPENSLQDVKKLQEFKLFNSRNLTTLPWNLFKSSPNLTKLGLCCNNFTSLPSNIFSSLHNIEEIDLSNNRLGSISDDYSLQTVSHLKSLKVLNLSNNPLGDLCEGSSIVSAKNNSPLSELVDLEELNLAATRLTRICADWKDAMMNLRELDLSSNRIEQLEPSDFDWSRFDDDAEVNLNDNLIKRIELPRDKFIGPPARKTVRMMINSVLNCDCRLYRFANAAIRGWLPVDLPANDELMCAEPPPKNYSSFRKLKLRKMTCSENKYCPTNCTCELRAFDDTTVISCQNRGLNSMPNLKIIGENFEYPNLNLYISDNDLTTIPDNLHTNLIKLDIRRNKIKEFSKEVAEKLTNSSSRLKVWLAGNPLTCRCGDPLLRRLAVFEAGSVIQDLGESTCPDHKLLLDASHDSCWQETAVVWGIGGAAVTALVTATVFIALKKAVRLRLKVILYTRGLCLRWVKPDDNDDCKYDAFLSFSHLDTEYAEQILQELESGPKRLKFCVHYRDWPVGIWIPAQIARSVAESRRTVILLSDNYVGSSWARAEFREAYAKAILGTSVRLIVVVIGDKPPKGLDDELQHYVSNNTYVKWGEPAFWEKLRKALPEPRNIPKKPRNSHKTRKSTETESRKSQKPRKRRKYRKKKQVSSNQTPNQNQNGNVNTLPEIVVVPNSPNAAPSPPTPIVKFSQIDFPAPIKQPKQEFSACA